LTLINLV